MLVERGRIFRKRRHTMLKMILRRLL